MNDPYENQYIGAFVYALGFQTGASQTGKKLSAAVDLIQQTKADPCYGDLIYQEGGTGFIIEFKRDSTKLISERTKETKKPLHKSIKALTDDSLISTSRKCHFLAYGMANGKVGEKTIKFVNYLDWLLQYSGIIPYDLESFINNVITRSVGVENEEFKKYLRFLESSGGGETGGLIVTISKDGKIQLINVPQIGGMEGPAQSMTISAPTPIIQPPSKGYTPGR